MRGKDEQQQALFSYGSMEDRVPADHPLRAIRASVDHILAKLSPKFDELYDADGRPSIAPERLLRALLLQVLYSVRSERMLMEQLQYNLLFRWFVGLTMDEPVWHATVFTKNRDRLLEGQIAEEFFQAVLYQARLHRLLSSEHFTVDGTLIEAWAGQKSFQPKRSGDGANPPTAPPPGSNPTLDYRGQKRGNATHESTTDPESRLYRKGNNVEAKLCYLGHVVMENRNGFVVDTRLTPATGTAEREAALEMAAALPGGQARVTLGADKAYDTQEFVKRLREINVTPHVAQNNGHRRSAIDGRTTTQPGYEISQRKRKRVEEVFGWLKTVAGMRKTKFRGTDRIGWMFTFATAAFNLIRMRNLLAATA